jgi:two-component system alkaline phosphatase synthesis response regulator PhoP
MAKVLIVEDEEPISHAYQLVLEQAGLTVLVASQAQQGIELALSEQPNVILMDVMMPDVNGLEMLKKLDIKKNLPHTKVIALSNVETQAVVDETLKLGAVDYLRKVDYTPHQIVEVVRKHLTE